MVSGIGVDSGQQMSEADLNPTTDLRPTGSPFVGLLIDERLLIMDAETETEGARE